MVYAIFDINVYKDTINEMRMQVGADIMEYDNYEIYDYVIIRFMRYVVENKNAIVF